MDSCLDDLYTFILEEDKTPGFLYDKCNHITAGGGLSQMEVKGHVGYTIAPQKIKNAGLHIKEERKPVKQKSKSLKRMLNK